MKNNFLINKGYYIKNDLDSLLLYFDYFSQGLTLPKYLSYPLIRKIVHILLRVFIVISYITRAYKLMYKITSLNDDAILVIKGRGKWGSSIRLVNKNGNLKIIKKVANRNIYLAEKNFYMSYVNNQTRIKLPMHIFHKKNIIEIDFLRLKSFQRMILDGTCNVNKSMSHLKQIRNQIKLVYSSKPGLAHGDLWPGNIFIHKNFYYLIDFSDSYTNSDLYDIYTLLYSVLSSCHYIKINEKTISDFTFNNMSILKLLNTTKKTLNKIEKEFINYRSKRFPGVYYN